MVGSVTFTLKLKLPLRVTTVSFCKLRGLAKMRSVSGVFFKLPLKVHFSFELAAFVTTGIRVVMMAAKLIKNLFMLVFLG